MESLLGQVEDADVISIVGIPALAMDFSKRACARFGVSHLSQLWPNLGSYSFGGVHLSEKDKTEIKAAWFHREKPMHFIESYFASEGPLAITFNPDDPGLALNTLESLYMFREDPDDGPFLFAHELKKGKVYSVYVTTPGGLVNYHMGDRVEVVEERPLLVQVAGREADEISMTGEKLTLEQFELALATVGLDSSSLEECLVVVWVEDGDQPHLVFGVPENLYPSGAEAVSDLVSPAGCGSLPIQYPLSGGTHDREGHCPFRRRIDPEFLSLRITEEICWALPSSSRKGFSNPKRTFGKRTDGGRASAYGVGL